MPAPLRRRLRDTRRRSPPTRAERRHDGQSRRVRAPSSAGSVRRGRRVASGRRDGMHQPESGLRSLLFPPPRRRCRPEPSTARQSSGRARRPDAGCARGWRSAYATHRITRIPAPAHDRNRRSRRAAHSRKTAVPARNRPPPSTPRWHRRDPCGIADPTPSRTPDTRRRHGSA